MSTKPAPPPDILIDVHDLKHHSQSDRLMDHLLSRRNECENRRIAYWAHHRQMRDRHNYISIPLLVVSSATGVVSAAQFNSKGNIDVTIATTVLGVLSAVLSSVQRYCGYSERAENSKLMAKSWARLRRKIENTMVYIESSSCMINNTVFTKLVEEIQKDIESVAQQADDLPQSLLQKRDASLVALDAWKNPIFHSEECTSTDGAPSEHRHASDAV